MIMKFHHSIITHSNSEMKQSKWLSKILSYLRVLWFSIPEQSYFNYFLNKSEFTNGLDLRNSYLHGTQANPGDVQIHEYAYFTYLKLLFLVLLKIEDDLILSKVIADRE